LSFLRIGARYSEKLVGHDVTLKLLADMREWLFRRLIPRAPLRGVGLRHGDLVSRLLADVDALDAVFITAIGPGLTALMIGAGLVAILARLAPTGGIVFGLGFAAAALLAPALLVLATRRSGRALVGGKVRLRIAVLDGIEGHADLLAFGRAQDARAGVAAAANELAVIARGQNRAGAAATAAVVLLAGVTTLGVILAGIDEFHRHEIGGPTLVGLALAVLASFEAAGLVVRNAGSFGAALAAADRLRALTSAPPAVSEPANAIRLPQGGDLVFDNVWFARRSERPLLRGLSLECAAGSRTAIIGASGCGKSTLLDLALRLADPDGGAVRVAGVDLTDVAQADLHVRVALMSQSTPVFLGTIRDNLRLARPDAVDAELWEALARARLADFVRSLPNGLETWCGEGGRTLSRGQARRLCLARTLLTRAAILLLDEPTAGLDRAAERALLEDLANATAGRTVIIVTHADLAPGAVDRVLLLADGRLAEVG
jgi:ATP-binding cassette subfamily C protein CydC